MEEGIINLDKNFYGIFFKMDGFFKINFSVSRLELDVVLEKGFYLSFICIDEKS